MKITLEGLTKQFPARGRKAQGVTTAVENLSFEVPDGKDPAKIPVPELLVRLLLGNVNGEWKAFAIFFN